MQTTTTIIGIGIGLSSYGTTGGVTPVDGVYVDESDYNYNDEI